MSPVIRVGMPLPSGRLTEYGIASGKPLMFSANAFATYRAGAFAGFNLRAARAIPDNCDAALDSAGFVAAVRYGDYLFDVDQYLDLVATRRWAFWSSMDSCVEDQVAPDHAMRRLRVDTTIARYFECARKAADRGLPPPLPVLQGRFPSEYLRCAEAMGINESTKMVGLGSVCRRSLHGPDGVLAIVAALDRELPRNVVLHGFGLKGAGTLGILMRVFPGRVGSIDSMAWDMGIRRAMPTGRTQEARALAMIEWHERETRQLTEGRAVPSILPATQPEPTASSVALDRLGKAHGELVLTGDISYLDARSYLAQARGLVEHLIRACGPDAFADDDPAPGDDYGLGTAVYAEIREGLIEHGYLN